MKMRKLLIWRWTFFIVGMMIMSLGVSMTIKGQRLGISPWDVLHVGLYKNFGLSIGTWGILTGLIIVVCTALVLRQLPKLGTILNMILIGLFIDLFNWLLPDIISTVGQVTIYVLGVVVIAYGVGVYVCPNMGAGPRDSLMLLFVEKFNLSIRTVRTIIEITVGVVGWLLGGPVGIGTVLIALFTGQIIQFALPQCRKLLLKIAGETDENVLFVTNGRT